MDWAKSANGVSPHLVRAPHLHHHHAGFELAFGRAFEKLIDFFLVQLSDLLVSTLLTYRAWNILDFDKLGLYGRSR
jgi:hypothetical protein